MGLVADHECAEALFVEVAPAAEPAVEGLRVDAEQPVHPGRDLPAGRLEDQVEVGAEQAPGVYAQAEALCRDPEQAREGGPVALLAEDQDSARAAARHVPDPVRKLKAAQACHLPFEASPPRGTPPSA